jgi:hypothetical protein
MHGKLEKTGKEIPASYFNTVFWYNVYVRTVTLMEFINLPV